MIAHISEYQVPPEVQAHRDEIREAVDAASRKVWEKMQPACELYGSCEATMGEEDCIFEACPCLRLKQVA